MAEKGIVYRLGWALYWAACIPAGISLLFVAFGLYGLIAYGLIAGWPDEETSRQHIDAFSGGIVGALFFWLPGRAIRYVLAGD